MAESTLTADITEIRRWLARFMGWPRTFADWGTTRTLDGNDFINGGLRLFYNAGPTERGRKAWVWSFLRPVTTFASVAPYDTGTVVILHGLVSLTGGTFPTDAADRDLVVDGTTYSVATRNTGTLLTLDDLSVSVSGENDYSLVKPVYDLPDDFGGFDGPLTYIPGQNVCFTGEVVITDERRLRVLRQRWDVTGKPQFAAVRPKTLDPTDGQRSQLTMLPIPDAVYNFEYRYIVHPDALDGTNIYHYGGMSHSQTIIAAVLAVADLQMNDGSKGKMQEFLQLLQASIDRDKQAFAPDNLGYNGENSDRPYEESYGPLTTDLASTWAS